jgi:hypothetical protein
LDFARKWSEPDAEHIEDSFSGRVALPLDKTFGAAFNKTFGVAFDETL